MTLCSGEIEPATISVARRSLSPMRTWTGVRLPLLSSTHSVTGMPWVALSGLSCALLDATMPAGRNSSWAMGWPCFTVALKSATAPKLGRTVVIRPRKGRESHLRFCCQGRPSLRRWIAPAMRTSGTQIRSPGHAEQRAHLRRGWRRRAPSAHSGRRPAAPTAQQAHQRRLSPSGDELALLDREGDIRDGTDSRLTRVVMFVEV